MAYGPHALLLIAFTVAACGTHKKFSDAIVAPPIDAGWHYSWDDGTPRTGYGLSPSPMMGFYGHCDYGPIYALIGGDYSSKAASVALSVDGKTRYFKIYRGIHGASLLFTADTEIPSVAEAARHQEDRSIANDLAMAKKTIVIETNDGWTRAVPPNVNLSRFMRECIQFRAEEEPIARCPKISHGSSSPQSGICLPGANH